MTKSKPLSYADKLREKILQEELEKQKNLVLPDVLKDCLPYQLQFIQDPHKRKVVCSTRRSAKTYGVCLYMVDTAIKIRQAKVAYISLTNESAKRIVWSSIIELICLRHNIQAELIDSKNEIRFANGSIIYLVGLDSTPKQMNRLRGNAYDLAIIDESQDFTQDLRQVYQDVLKMTLAQTNATCCLVGTPGNQLGLHYWYLINKENSEETEWKRFFFDWRNNTAIDPKSNKRICDAIQEEVDKDIKRNPLIINDPAYRREILGEWVVETSARIYRYEPNLNDITELPSLAFLRTATYLLGFDLGYHPDPTALVIACYNPQYDNKLYVLSAEEHHKMITADLAKRIKELDKQYNFHAIVGDSANLNVVSDLNRTYGIVTQKAHKLGKLAHQNILNSDFIQNNINLVKNKTEILSKQLQTVIWEKKALALGNKVEDPKYDNHSCLIAGTKIETNNGEINIEDIKLDDLILTQNGYQKVIATSETGIHPLYKLTTANGRCLIGTADHPILIDNKYIPMKDLNPGDILYCITVNQKQQCPNQKKNELVQNVQSNSPEKRQPVQDRVLKVEKLGLVGKTYNLTVENEHQYYANGILTSNCDSLLYLHFYSRSYWFNPKEPKSLEFDRVQHTKDLTEKLINQNIDQYYQIDFLEPNG